MCVYVRLKVTLSKVEGLHLRLREEHCLNKFSRGKT